MHKHHLVVLDFPGIKKFVFGTDRLVEIRGASALLDQFNRYELPDLFYKKHGRERCDCIYAGGGACQFIVDDSAENIKSTIKMIQGKVLERSGGTLRLVAGIASLEKPYVQALEAAFLDMKKRKNENPFEQCSSIHTGFIRECDSCSKPASDISNYAGESRCLCQSCLNKEVSGRERGLWGDFSSYMAHHGIDEEKTIDQRVDNFEQIGERCQARNGYTALVYGDGNAMGRLIKQIRSKQQYRLFSEAVDTAIRESCHEALRSNCLPVNGKIPADVLLLGGDDLMVYLSADTAMPFALDVIRLFEEKTKEKLSKANQAIFPDNMIIQKGLTLSTGIAYGRSHTPISILVKQAEELLKSAKRKGSLLADADGRVPACVDFHLASRFNQVSAMNCRKHHLTFNTPSGETIRLYQGPYTHMEAESLMKHARQLKLSKIPNSRLHRLGEAPFRGKIKGTVETLTVYGRCRKGEEKQAIFDALKSFECLPLMPWHESKELTSTVIVDLVELCEFVSPRKEDADDASSDSY